MYKYSIQQQKNNHLEKKNERKQHKYKELFEATQRAHDVYKTSH